MANESLSEVLFRVGSVVVGGAPMSDLQWALGALTQTSATAN